MTTLPAADYIVLAIYLVGMIALGAWLSRRQKSGEEYFLAGRSMPWMAVGVSVIASILSSITYLSEPGEVWRSGVTHITGKMLAIPVEMALVWLVCIPFMMRFGFTSAYEYLEHRFGARTRTLGVTLFLVLAVCWMGVVVLVSSRMLAPVAGVPLWAVVVAVGLVATVYTILGGLRAVIWTDVVQVILLVGGALFVVGFIAIKTGSGLGDWYSATQTYLNASGPKEALPFFSLDPTVRATVVTVAVHMCVWHVCTHTANQMTVQRYFSTGGMVEARRSFVAGSLLGVGINLLLMVAGLAVLFYYQKTMGGQMPALVDPEKKKTFDLAYPSFVVDHLSGGLAGAMLAAILAAAMSSIDSGVNSIATVLTIERQRRRETTDEEDVTFARGITLAAGLFIIVAAFGMDRLTGDKNIIEMLPRTFNCLTGVLGGLFLVGMFLSWVGERAVIIAAICGLATAIGIAYSKEIFGMETPISFTWVMPGSLLVTLAMSAGLGAVLNERAARPGFTWFTRDKEPDMSPRKQ